MKSNKNINMKSNKNINMKNNKGIKTHKLFNKKKSTNHNITVKNIKKNKKGGEAVAAGSYGCVFRPPIRCNDSSTPYNPSYISKLMYNDESV